MELQSPLKDKIRNFQLQQSLDNKYGALRLEYVDPPPPIQIVSRHASDIGVDLDRIVRSRSVRPSTEELDQRSSRILAELDGLLNTPMSAKTGARAASERPEIG